MGYARLGGQCRSAASSVEEGQVTLAKGAVPLLTQVSPEPGSSRPRPVAIAASAD